jgi:hypothetical protein
MLSVLPGPIWEVCGRRAELPPADMCAHYHQHGTLVNLLLLLLMQCMCMQLALAYALNMRKWRYEGCRAGRDGRHSGANHALATIRTALWYSCCGCQQRVHAACIALCKVKVLGEGVVLSVVGGGGEQGPHLSIMYPSPSA